MSDENWDDESCANYVTVIKPQIDAGTDFGRGRGFIPISKQRDAEDKVYFKIPYNENKGKPCSTFQNSFGTQRGRGDRGRPGTGNMNDQGDSRCSVKDERKSYTSTISELDFKGKKKTCDKHATPEKSREIYIPPEPSNDEDVIFRSGNMTGINFDKYDDIQVNVTGENIVNPIDNFENSGLRTLLLNNIKQSAYAKPTPIQKHAIPTVMQGRDVMACAQTGSGKTAAFLLPIIHKLLNEPKDLVKAQHYCEPQAVIISPTRELTIQISNEARKFAYGSVIKTVVVYGGASVSHQSRKIAEGCHIVVATPGRLVDFMKKDKIMFSGVRFLVLDEADRMLDMGFKDSIEAILEHPTMVNSGMRQTLMFSATFPLEIQKLAGKFLNNYIFIAIGNVGGACTDVEQHFYNLDKYEKRPKLIELLAAEGGKKTLVFVETKRDTDFLACVLCEKQLPATSIHGDRYQREREEALADFISGHRGILVATSVAARGLDIKNVSHVINYDLPNSIDDYVHRIGRTGRVGNKGKATSFYESSHDAPLAPDLVKILRQANQKIPKWLEDDAALATSSASILGKFGGKDFRKFPVNNDKANFESFDSMVANPMEEW